MISFESDYIAGAHPDVLARLEQTNLVSCTGYGADPYCEAAKEKIREACAAPEADVEFLVGGTQANATVISTMLRDYEGVIAAASGHIAAHEAASVEYTGHKVLTIPGKEGKIEAKVLNDFVDAFYADENHEHMVFPGMVYLSWPTELGTIYTKAELTAISQICHERGMRLYLDGARLGYGLMSPACDLTLPEIAQLCDVFTIGGTKVGALCGEAVVFRKGARPPHFMTSLKRRGGLLAKGRLLGVQFDALFTDGLYWKISRHAIDLAMQMKKIFAEAGLQFYLDSPTNQQFVVVENSRMEQLREKVVFSFMEQYDASHTVIRFVTGWSTTEEDLQVLREILL